MTPIIKTNHCESKRPFRSRKSVQNFLKSAKRHGVIISDFLGEYWCKYCGKWHLGHKKKGGEVRCVI